MPLLLDTHIFIWLATGQFARIRRATLAALRDTANACHVSALSMVEVELKMALGRFEFSLDWDSALRTSACRWLDFSSNHARALRSLPLLHRDPFDRMLAAQALAEDFTLVTADEKLLAYPIKTMRA